jgi:hypothetical protein
MEQFIISELIDDALIGIERRMTALGRYTHPPISRTLGVMSDFRDIMKHRNMAGYIDNIPRCQCIRDTLDGMLRASVIEHPVGIWFTEVLNISDIVLAANIINAVNHIDSVDGLYALAGMGNGMYNPVLKASISTVIPYIKNIHPYDEIFNTAITKHRDAKRDVTRVFLSHLYDVLNQA